MSIRSYKYRIEPNKAQSAAIADMLADFCRLYNGCLEQRIDAWERRQISVGCNMQAAELKAVRRTRTRAAVLLCRTTGVAPSRQDLQGLLRQSARISSLPCHRPLSCGRVPCRRWPDDP